MRLGCTDLVALFAQRYYLADSCVLRSGCDLRTRRNDLIDVGLFGWMVCPVDLGKPSSRLVVAHHMLYKVTKKSRTGEVGI